MPNFVSLECLAMLGDLGLGLVMDLMVMKTLPQLAHRLYSNNENISLGFMHHAQPMFTALWC